LPMNILSATQVVFRMHLLRLVCAVLLIRKVSTFTSSTQLIQRVHYSVMYLHVIHP
jgi:hypothetical protein